MQKSDYIPSPDPAFREWLENFVDYAAANMAALGLTLGQIAEMQAVRVAFVTAYIDLNEGDRMATVLRGVDPMKPEQIKIGAKVRVEFEPASEDVHIPFWRVV